MKKLIVFLLLPTLFFSFPLSAQAQEELEPTLLINEYAPPAHELDTAWIELFNLSEQQLDLSTYQLYLDNELFLLSGSLDPAQYFVIALEEPLLEHIRLEDPNGELVDDWDIPQDILPLQSLIREENDALTVTDLTTAGRANSFLERDHLLACLAEEDAQTVDPQVEEEISNQEDDRPEPEDKTELVQVPIATSGAIKLSELFANPEGDETTQEFIELFNADEEAIQLKGWKLADASKPFLLPEQILQPGDYLALFRPQTGIALNNSNETVTLTDARGIVLAEIHYETTTEALSLNEDNPDWYEASPTPGKKNTEKTIVIVAEEEEEIGSLEEQESEESGIQEGSSLQELDPDLDQIRLNEVLPNPEGSDALEWIELFNPTDAQVELAGLTIADLTNAFELQSGTMPAQSYFLLPKLLTGLSLNNSNEELVLRMNGHVIDRFSYTTSKEGRSWARNADNEWQETNPSPGEENSFEDKISEKQENLVTKKPADSKKEEKTQAAALVEWSSGKEKDQVMVEGIISVLPGTFQKRTAFLQTEDAGIELYFHLAQWPELILGQRVLVQGEKSLPKSGPRLLIHSADAIELESKAPEQSFIELDATKPIDESLHHQVIAIQASLIEQKKTSLTAIAGDNELTIDLKKGGLTLNELSLPQEATLIGLLEFTDKGITLVPRQLDDITLKPVEAEIIPNAELTPPTFIEPTVEPQHTKTQFLVLLGTSGCLGLAYVYRQKLRELMASTALMVKAKL